jgi:death-on-curing protein
MIRYLNIVEVLDLHRQIIEQSKGARGIRDLGALESPMAQPLMTFARKDICTRLLLIKLRL